MSKNTDFFILVPIHVKTVLELEPGQKSGKQRATRPKQPFHAHSRANSALTTRVDMRLSQAPRAALLRSRGSVNLVWLGSARICSSTRLCRRHVLSPRWSCVAPADGRRVSGACHAAVRLSPADLFFSSLSSEIRNTALFSNFRIFRFVDRIDMISSVKF